MKDEFLKYLESIGMTKTLRKRVETIYAFYTETCPDEITDIFVSDYIKEDRTREYQNLWFFSPKCCMEAHSFITEDYFDIDAMQNRIATWEIRKQDYDFKKATEKSRLHLVFWLPPDRHAEFKASKENCDYLKDIFLKYVVPNLIQCEKARDFGKEDTA